MLWGDGTETRQVKLLRAGRGENTDVLVVS